MVSLQVVDSDVACSGERFKQSGNGFHLRLPIPLLEVWKHVLGPGARGHLHTVFTNDNARSSDRMPGSREITVREMRADGVLPGSGCL